MRIVTSAGASAWLLPTKAGAAILLVIIPGLTTATRITLETASDEVLVVVVIGESPDARIQSALLISGVYSAILTKILLA